MPRQPDLFQSAPLAVHPPSRRRQPRLWVRRLTLWAEPGSEIRGITLRPGLNVVWSPDPADRGSGTTATGSAGDLGHGSGKTLFCRLLRYCLGEERFATDEQRHAIADAFPKGWVSAEVMLDERPWAVLRPLGFERGHFAVPDVLPGALFDRLDAPTGIEPLIAEIEATILTPEVAALVPADHALDAWRIALAWLTRDQECRFHHVLDWRSPDSDSGSPTRSMSGLRLQEALRALIGAIVADEIQLRRDITALEDRHKALVIQVDRRQWACRQLRDHVARTVGLAPHEVPDGRLSVEALGHAARQSLAAAVRIDTAHGDGDLQALRDRLESSQRQLSELETRLAVAQQQSPLLEQLLGRLRAELPIASAQLRDAQVPVCPLCEVPIDRVLADGCKLSRDLPDFESIARRHQGVQKQINEQAEALESARRVERAASQQLPALRRAHEALQKQLQAAERLHQARSGAWFRTRRALDDVRRLDEELAVLASDEADLADLTQRIEQQRERTGSFREAQREVFSHLSTLFDAVIQTLVGPAARSRVILDGQGLKLSVDLGGERSTAAIESLKVIAFDLAVMCMSVEERTHLPAFLVHDSPREADLGLSVYYRLFAMVADLERNDSPTFQYIVTTTTQPPPDMQAAPWLRETLHGAPASQRLLRRDLS